jgi:hypothetical protein
LFTLIQYRQFDLDSRKSFVLSLDLSIVEVVRSMLDNDFGDANKMADYRPNILYLLESGADQLSTFPCRWLSFFLFCILFGDLIQLLHNVRQTTLKRKVDKSNSRNQKMHK